MRLSGQTGLPPAMPGSGEWITAENVGEVANEERFTGSFRRGGAVVRRREMEEKEGEGNGEGEKEGGRRSGGGWIRRRGVVDEVEAWWRQRI